MHGTLTDGITSNAYTPLEKKNAQTEGVIEHRLSMYRAFIALLSEVALTAQSMQAVRKQKVNEINGPFLLIDSDHH